VSTSAPKGRTFLQRLIGAAALRAETYEEVEADQGATRQAVLVVVSSSAAAGLGARGFGAGDAGDVVFFATVALMAWVAWAFVVYQIGARILPGARTRTDVGELLRTTGFATAPGLIRVVGMVPGLTIPSFAVAALWMLAAMIIAVRQALDYTSTPRAVAVCVLGWVLAIALGILFGVLFGPSVS
jgi:Yip1-like protein